MAIRKYLGWLVAGSLLTPLPASAVPVTWNFTGGITQISNRGADLPGFVNVGSTYNLAVTFDTALFPSSASSTCNADGCSSLYATFSNSAVRMSVDFGSDCEGGAGYQPCSSGLGAATVDQIWLFNDHRIPAVSSNFLDRMTFVIFPDGNALGRSRWNFTLTGPTDIFSSITTGLPTSQDSRFNFQELRICDQIDVIPSTTLTNAFSPCKAGSQLVVGSNILAVPEPATLALVCLGITGIALARRRNRAG